MPTAVQLESSAKKRGPLPFQKAAGVLSLRLCFPASLRCKSDRLLSRIYAFEQEAAERAEPWDKLRMPLQDPPEHSLNGERMRSIPIH